MHGINDAGTRLLFKFRAGSDGLNEELGKGGQERVCCVGMSVRVFVMHCGNVQHIVLLELTFCRICRNALEIVFTFRSYE